MPSGVTSASSASASSRVSTRSCSASWTPSHADRWRLSSRRSSNRPAAYVAGPVELVHVDRLVAHALQLAEHRLDRFGQVVGVDAGVDLERAAIGVVGLEAVDVVGQAGVLAQLLEEAAARPLAEDRVEHLERPLVGVIARQRRQAESDMSLGDVAMLDAQPLLGERRCGAEAGDDAVAGAEAAR